LLLISGFSKELFGEQRVSPTTELRGVSELRELHEIIRGVGEVSGYIR
jgi:hypothetical protein